MTDTSATSGQPSTLRSLYPPIEPFVTGFLDVGDGQSMYWEVSGNPDASRWCSCTVAPAVVRNRRYASSSIRPHTASFYSTSAAAGGPPLTLPTAPTCR